MCEFSIKDKSSSSSSESSTYISKSLELDKVSTTVCKDSSEYSDNDYSSNNNLNDNNDLGSYGSTIYLKQFSFDPGLSSSESDTAYERLDEARKRNKLDLHLKKLLHESSFRDIEIPNWAGMSVKKWKPHKIRIRFYTQQLANSNSAVDNKYDVCLKTNQKFQWYVSSSSAPFEINIRTPFITAGNVTNKNLRKILGKVYKSVKRFSQKCVM